MEPDQSPTGAAFPVTHDSLLTLAAAPDPAVYRAAWERFFREYWPPLYTYLRRTGSTRDDALDQLQEFFLKGMEGGLLARFDRGRGRFRTYLLTCLMNLRRDAWRRDRVRPDRHAMPILSTDALDASLDAPCASAPEEAFDDEWARHVLHRAIAVLVEEMEAAKDRISLRLLRGWVLATGRGPAEGLATELGITTGDLYMRATRLRRALAARIAKDVSIYSADVRDAERERDDLVRRLAEGAGGGPPAP